jgi:cytochrome b561/polyisoprenoid-binding protein YceI
VAQAIQPARYSGIAICLHWLIALALACELGLGFALPEAPAGFALWQLHKSIGIAILALTIVRIGWRLLRKPPASLEAGLVGALARAAHVAFYALLLLAPLTGWAIVSTSPTRIPTILFGRIGFPHLPLPDALNRAAEQSHAVLAWIGLALIGLHIAGVLRHELLLRHGGMRRMSPGGRSAVGLVLGLAVVLAGGATFAMVDRQAPIAPVSAIRPAPGKTSRAAPPPAPATSPQSAQAGAAEPPSWSIRPGGRLGFSVANGGEAIEGRFAKWGGAIRFDPAHPATAEIAIEIDLASATVGDATQDKMLAGEEYFSTAAFPKAAMRISSARRTGPDSYVAQGRLELKGVTRPQAIEFRLTGSGSRRHIEGTASIARAPFAIGTGATGGELAPAVVVRFSFDAVQSAG